MRCLSATFIGLAVLLLAEVAQAVDVGVCDTPENMTAMMKAEGQRSIMSADHYTPDESLLGMIFTVNKEQSVGYILQSDNPVGYRASKMCVYSRLADVRLFDARRSGVPSGALLKAPESEALRHCDEMARLGEIKRESCGSLNTLLRLADTEGSRVMLQGLVVEKQPNGSFKPNGTLVTVDGRLNENPQSESKTIKNKGVITYSSLPDGASYIKAFLFFPQYTPYGLSLLP